MFAKNFNYEIKPKAPKEIGYFLINWSLTFSGKMEASKPLFNSTVKNDKEFEIAFENKVSDSITTKLALKGQPDDWQNLIEAVKSADKKKVTEALSKMLGLEAGFSWINSENFEAQSGLQIDTCPFFTKVKGKGAEVYTIGGQPVNFEFSVEGGFFLGLSPKGWQFVISKVGKEAVKRLLVQAGARFAPLLASLTASGLLTAGAIVVGAVGCSVALLALTAKLIADARTSGMMIGLATWYKSAYLAKVFDSSRPYGYVAGDRYVPNANEIKESMIDEGERDAILDARTSARNFKYPDLNTLSDEEMLQRYKRAWFDAVNASSRYKYDTVKWMIENMLNQRILKKFNIKMYGNSYFSTERLAGPGSSQLKSVMGF